MEISITKMGERGQVVIPQDIRDGVKTGEKIIIVKENNKWVLEPVKNIKAETINKLSEDLIDMKIASDFWENVKKGKTKLIRQTSEEFLKDLEKW